jgi:hypothetical protein
MLHYGVTAATWVVAFLGVAGFIGRVVTAVQERRNAEKQRKADRERIIAQQDRIIEQRQERLIAQQRRDAAETQDR